MDRESERPVAAPLPDVVDACLELHVYPVPFHPARPGRARRPASTHGGYTRPVPVQALAAIRLFADHGKASRLAVWKDDAVRWWDTFGDAQDADASTGAVLEILATLAADDPSRRLAEELARRLGQPLALPAHVQRQLKPAIDYVIREAATRGSAADLPPPLFGHGDGDPASSARRALRWLEASGDPLEVDRWRVRMFLRAGMGLRVGPGWRLLLDGGRALAATDPALEAAYGTELDRWANSLSRAIERSGRPGRRKAPADDLVLPPRGETLADHADQRVVLPRLLAEAGRNPALAADLMARHFLRVVFGELFIDAGDRFESDTEHRLLAPLAALVEHLAQDPAFADVARETLRALRPFAGFGGTVPLNESFAASYARVAAAPQGYSAAAQSALRMAAQGSRGDDSAPWIDAFRPNAAAFRARRVASPAGADAGLEKRLQDVHDLALVVADAMRDVLLLCCWSRAMPSGVAAPDFGTWKRHLGRIPQSGLAPERQFDRQTVAGIVARMDDDGFVAQVRRILRELDEHP